MDRQDTTPKISEIRRLATSSLNNDEEDEILAAFRFRKVASAMQLSQRTEENNVEAVMETLELKTGKKNN